MPEPMPGESTPEPEEPGRFYRASAVFYFLLAVAAVVWIGLERGTVPIDLFFVPATVFGDIACGLGAGGLIIVLAELGRRWFSPFARLEDRLRQMLVGVTESEAVAIALVSGFAEEIFFRGAVQGSWGWLWATLLFALMHTGPDRLIGLWTVFALFAGALFAGLTLMRGTILSAVIAHAFVNAVNLRRLVSMPEANATEQ